MKKQNFYERWAYRRFERKLKQAFKNYNELPLSKSLTAELGPDDKLPMPSPERLDDYLDVYGVESWVYICVRKLATSLAALPLNLYKKDLKTNKRVKINEHPALIWAEQPNPYMTKFLFWQTIVSFLKLTGNAYIEKVFEDNDITKKVVALYPVNPLSMEVVPDTKTYIKEYKFTSLVTGESKTISKERIVHIRDFSPLDSYHGISPIGAASVAITLDLYSQAYNQMFFKQGAKPPFLLTTEQHLTPKDIRVLRMQVKSFISGVKNAHLPLVLYNGLKAFNLSQTHKDTEFVSQRKLSREEICSVLGVFPIIAGIFEDTNFASAYAQKELYYTETMRPLAQMLKEVLSKEALSSYNAELTGEVLYFEHNFDDVLKANPEIRYKAYYDLMEQGALTANKVAALENWEAVPWGDTWYMPINKIPVEMVTDPSMTGKERATFLLEYVKALGKLNYTSKGDKK